MAEAGPLRVSVVEDDADIRAMLREVFTTSDGFRLVNTYRSSELALADVGTEQPDVMVVDVNLPGMDGIEFVRQMAERKKGIQFMMYTVYDDDKRIFDALRFGASGFLLKNSTPDEIVAAVREIHDGGAPMSAAIARRVVDHFKQRPSAVPILEEHLGEREAEVLKLLAEGLLYKEIAAQLGISIGTVKNHVFRVYAKLQVQNRTEATNRYFGR
ncbi:MAG: response regulator transcription factor [Flavobacteriales bacterium]|nr:response regulator transcription factor [Flavobacteriales bacterium]